MSNLPKIVILIPCFGRPLLTNLCFTHLSLFKNRVKENWNIEVVVVLSPEDNSFEELEKYTDNFGFHKFYYKNLRLGCKMNAGIDYILRNFTFDYLTNFGSDDLIHPNIVKLYEPCIQNNCLFFGLNKYYVYDVLTDRSFLFRTREEKKIAVGAGRMIHRSILDEFRIKNIPVYNSVNSALDASSRNNIHAAFKIYETVIDSGAFPYIVDMKTPNNITTLEKLETLTSLYESVDTLVLREQFNTIEKISGKNHSDHTFDNVLIENKENIASARNISYSNLIERYSALFRIQFQHELKTEIKDSKLYKLQNDLLNGLMLETMHQEYEQLKSKNKEIKAIHDSLSWKITAPLRFVHSKLFS